MHTFHLFRANVLTSTLRDYVENWNGCFFAGKFVDEGFRLLKIIKLEQPLVPPGFELVKELDDLGTMARDHFERAIKPTLRKSSWRENLDPVTPIAPVPLTPLAMTSDQKRIADLEEKVWLLLDWKASMEAKERPAVAA